MKQKILMLISLLWILQACYRDKGNYNLVDYNQTTITSNSKRTVILGDTLNLSTVIKWKYPDRDTTDFRYEWRLEDSLISTDRDLKYVPSKTGLKMYHFYVIENSTNIASRFSWQISCNSPYKAGWLILTENNGSSELTYIRRDQKRDANNQIVYNYVLYKDFYSKSFPSNPLGNGPKKLVVKIFPDNNSDQILVLQNQESVFLNGGDMSKLINLSEDFPVGTIPAGAKVVDYIDGGSANFALVDNGSVYWKRNAKTMGGMHDELFIKEPMYFEGGGANISLFVNSQIFNSSFLFMYDKDKKRFVSVYTTTGSNDYVGNKMYINNNPAPPANFVDLNNMNGYKILYTADYANSAYYMNIIKQESTGNYYYQTYRTAQKLLALDVSQHYQELFAGNGLISDNSVFYRTYSSSYLYFAEGSKLYFYDVNTKRVKLYKDFGSGTIKRISGDAVDTELGVLLDNGSFYICSLKNNILGEANPGETGVLFEVKGLGTVVDMQWKWGSYFDYIFRRYPV